MDKISKEEANYHYGKSQHHCGRVLKDDKNYCKFFRGSEFKVGSCTQVIGIIEPYMGCKLFQKVGT